MLVNAISPSKPVNFCHQYTLSISALALGVILTISGVFAYLALQGNLPANALSLQKFSVIGLHNSYFMIVGGGMLTLLAASALICVFKKHGKVNSG